MLLHIYATNPENTTPYIIYRRPVLSASFRVVFERISTITNDCQYVTRTESIFGRIPCGLDVADEPLPAKATAVPWLYRGCTEVLIFSTAVLPRYSHGTAMVLPWYWHGTPRGASTDI